MDAANDVKEKNKQLNEWVAFLQEANNNFIDKRMLNYAEFMDKGLKEWVEIYKEAKELPDINYIPIQQKFRIISEVRPPESNQQLEILTENLKYYKSEGYDTVLVGFDRNDSPSDVINTVKYIIQYCDMKVWATYTGGETLKTSVFMDPKKYKEILIGIAPYISGYVNSWRRTSAHLWQQDEEFMKYTNNILRSANPNLPIIGELYYGNSHKYQGEGKIGFCLNNFKNSSAIMVVNFGFKKIDINYLINTILKPYVNNNQIIGCVVGQKPYYLLQNANGLNYMENMKIKHEIENEFFKNGCIGTITLSNDGKELESNNLSKTLYNTLNSKN